MNGSSCIYLFVSALVRDFISASILHLLMRCPSWCLLVFAVTISTRKEWWGVNWWCGGGSWALVLGRFSKPSKTGLVIPSLERVSKPGAFPDFCIQATKNRLVVLLCFQAALPKEQEQMSYLWTISVFPYDCFAPVSSNAEISSHPSAHLQGFVSWKQVRWAKYTLETASKANPSGMASEGSRNQMNNKVFSQVCSPTNSEITLCRLSGITGMCLEGQSWGFAALNEVITSLLYHQLSHTSPWGRECFLIYALSLVPHVLRWCEVKLTALCKWNFFFSPKNFPSLAVAFVRSGRSQHCYTKLLLLRI